MNLIMIIVLLDVFNVYVRYTPERLRYIVSNSGLRPSFDTISVRP